MPDPALTAAIREAYASAPSDVVILHTLEIRHPTFAAPIRIVRNFADTETWLALDGAEVQAVLDGLDAETRDQIGLVARLEAGAPVNGGEMVAFLAMAFDLDLPPVESLPVPEIAGWIDAVGREITDALDLAATSTELTEVTYRPYLSTDIEGPQMDPPVTLIASEVKADLLRCTFRARMLDIGNRAFPNRTYTAAEFPGLVR